MNKSETLATSVIRVNERLQFKGHVDGNEPVLIDYIPPLGDNLGYTSMELLLLSLSSCVGSAILVVLKKMQKSVGAFEIMAEGQRKQEHPTGFRTIVLDIHLQSDNVTGPDMDKVISLIDGLCPVLSMLKGNVEITHRYHINKLL